jgi:hypothetical protein
MDGVDDQDVAQTYVGDVPGLSISRYPVCDGCPPVSLHGDTFPTGSAEQRSGGAGGRVVHSAAAIASIKV